VRSVRLEQSGSTTRPACRRPRLTRSPSRKPWLAAKLVSATGTDHRRIVRVADADHADRGHHDVTRSASSPSDRAEPGSRMRPYHGVGQVTRPGGPASSRPRSGSPGHLDVAAERNPGRLRYSRFPPCELEHGGGRSPGKSGLTRTLPPFGDQKVSELVDEDHDAQHESAPGRSQFKTTANSL
jgi:hypothetical protein